MAPGDAIRQKVNTPRSALINNEAAPCLLPNKNEMCTTPHHNTDSPGCRQPGPHLPPCHASSRAQRTCSLVAAGHTEGCSIRAVGDDGTDGGGRGWGGAHLFVACLNRCTIGQALFSRRSTVPSPNRDTSNTWRLILRVSIYMHMYHFDFFA